MKPYKSAIRHDYKDLSSGPLTPRQRRWSWFILGLALPVVTVALLLVSERNESKVPLEGQAAEAALSPAPILETAREPLPLPLPELPPAASAASEPELEPEPEPAPAAAAASTEFAGAIVDLLVERGDSLDVLFRRNGLSIADLHSMAELPEAGEYLRRVRPGDEIRIAHADGRVLSLSRELNEIEVLSITKNESGFAATMEQRDVELRTVGAHGVIETSLFEAGTAAGMADAVTMDMAYIFQWDVDFIQDVRVGDSFTVVYEQRWRDGERLRDGDIIAAEFVNQRKIYRAARYLDPGGRSDYYTPEGRSVRKAFIRAPVEFTRISSNFNPRRRHPVLNTIRAHRGVDYAAPSGTPVIAAGDGKVSFRGVEGGYGNAVILQHGGNITTLYGHLSRFGRQRVGARVQQGEVIGYVGQSGLATGPHLHYEYRVGGTHKNPRTVELPAAEPVPEEYRHDFTAATAPLWHQIDLYQQAQLAATAD